MTTILRLSVSYPIDEPLPQVLTTSVLVRSESNTVTEKAARAALEVVCGKPYGGIVVDDDGYGFEVDEDTVTEIDPEAPKSVYANNILLFCDTYFMPDEGNEDVYYDVFYDPDRPAHPYVVYAEWSDGPAAEFEKPPSPEEIEKLHSYWLQTVAELNETDRLADDLSDSAS